MSKRKLIVLLAGLLSGSFSCADQIVESTPLVSAPAGSLVIRARFSSIQDSLFTISCALSGCHSGSVSPNLSAGSAYDEIVNVPNTQIPGLNRITPGEPQNSYLYLKLIGSSEIVGERMPTRALPLPPVVSDSLKAWIARGAPRQP